MAIVTYWEQLTQAAIEAECHLLDAFKGAGLETSVYYRARLGGDLHLKSAERVMIYLMDQLAKQGKISHGKTSKSAHKRKKARSAKA